MTQEAATTKVWVFPSLSNMNAERYLTHDQVIDLISSPPADQLEYILEARTAGKGSQVYEDFKRLYGNCVKWGFQDVKSTTERPQLSNCLVYIDIDSDEITDIKEAKELLSQIPYIACLWVSLSGKGLGGLVVAQTTAETYAGIYRELQAEILSLTGYMLDSACSDPNRRNVLSYDPEMYVNPAPEMFVPTERASYVSDKDNSIFKKFNQHPTASQMSEEILEAANFRSVGKNRWLRSGKNKGVSAIFNLRGRFENSVHIFTDSDTTLEAGHYDYSALVCKYRFGNDYTKFTKWLHQDFFKTSNPARNKAIPSLIIDKTQGTAALPSANDKYLQVLNSHVSNSVEKTPIQWEAIDSEFGRMMRECEMSTGFHIEFFTGAALYAISSAFCGKAVIHVKGTYKTRPCVWSVTADSAGAAKSPPSNAMTMALHRFHAQLVQKYNADMIEYKAQEALFSEMSPAERKASSIAKPTTPPVCPIYLRTDGTTEGVLKVLAANGGFCTVHVDEFSGFMDSMGAYKKGSGSGGDMQTWLRLYNSQPISKANVGDSLYIESPYVPVHGTGVFTDLCEAMRNIKRTGFYERLEWFLPFEKPWRKFIERDEATAFCGAIYEFNEVIDRMVNYFYGLQSEIELKFDPALNKIMDNYERFFIEQSQRHVNMKQPSLASLYAKIEIQFHRLPALFWAFRNFQNSTQPIDFTITQADLAGGVGVLNYLISTYLVVHNEIFENSDYTVMSPSEVSDFRKQLLQVLFSFDKDLKGNVATDVINEVTPSAKKVSHSTVCEWLRKLKE